MTYVEIRFNIDNAAFDNGNRRIEIARILHELANDAADGQMGKYIYDINGNKIGTAGVWY